MSTNRLLRAQWQTHYAETNLLVCDFAWLSFSVLRLINWCQSDWLLWKAIFAFLRLPLCLLQPPLLHTSSTTMDSCNFFTRVLQLLLLKNNLLHQITSMPQHVRHCHGHQVQDYHQALKGEGSCGGGREWKRSTCKWECWQWENGDQEAKVILNDNFW